ncbi:unnamed protein product [Paramecium octaurelia]|uniref:Uncharacterized protein n=1 Tax=Paramecium octaurelia TaxID=43137 RepID=A0A8S1VNN1_PAROT|nr:unnamed protein product [Paramecium octaurelia]
MNLYYLEVLAIVIKTQKQTLIQMGIFIIGGIGYEAPDGVVTTKDSIHLIGIFEPKKFKQCEIQQMIFTHHRILFNCRRLNLIDDL